MSFTERGRERYPDYNALSFGEGIRAANFSKVHDYNLPGPLTQEGATPDLIWASFMRTFLAPARWLNYQRLFFFFFYEKNLPTGAEKCIHLIVWGSELLNPGAKLSVSVSGISDSP